MARAFVQLSANTTPASFPSTVPIPLTTSADADGSFELTSVSPGDYRLLAHGALPAPAGGTPDAFGWAATTMSIAGGLIDAGSIALQAGMTFSGRITIDPNSAKPAPDLKAPRVQMQAASLAMAPTSSRSGAPPGAAFLQPASVLPDGSFNVLDLVPDDYQLAVTGPALIGGDWWLRAATWRGHDLLDAPIHLDAGMDPSDVTLVLSDRRTELSGTLTTASGGAVSDVFVIAYLADPALRLPHSRRIQAVRPEKSSLLMR